MKLGIRTKFLTIIITVLVIVGFSVSTIYYRGFNRLMTKQVNENLTRIATSVATQIDDMNEKELSMLRSVALLDFYRNPEVSLKDKCFTLTKISSENRERYENVTYYDAKGDSYTADGRFINMKDRAYVSDALQGKECILPPLYSPVINEMLMFYSVPVYDFNHKIIGTIVSILRGNQLSVIASNIDIGSGIKPKIIDMAEKKIVGDGDDTTKGKETSSDTTDKNLENILKGINANSSGIYIYNRVNTNEKMICSYHPISKTNWTVLFTAPYNFFFSELTSMHFALTLGMGVCIVIAVIIITILISLTIKPLIFAKTSMESSIEQIAGGNADLTKKIETKSKDEIGDVVNTFNKFTETLRQIVSDIQNSEGDLDKAGEGLETVMEDTAKAVKNIMEDIENTSEQVETQTKSVTETANAIEDISKQISSLDRMIEEQAQSVGNASSSIKQMVGNIDSVNNSIEQMAITFEDLMQSTSQGEQKQQAVNEDIQEIAKESEMLQEANQTISDIANQTNLLAMNAAIEAAHAGDAGKGFSVVADEIRKLSETSSAQSKTIGEQLQKIENSISIVVKTSKESQAAFSGVFSKISQTGDIVNTIKTAMNEQLENSKQIEGSLDEMTSNSEKVLQASEKMEERASSIRTESEQLQEATQIIRKSIGKISDGADQISRDSAALTDISNRVNGSIKVMADNIGKFKT